MFSQHRRGSSSCSSVAVALALGAAALASVSAAPTLSGLGEFGSFGEDLALRERGGPPDIYERLNEGYRVKGSSSPSKRAKRKTLSRRSDERILRARQGACLDSTYTEDDINALLQIGGANTKVQLCPGAKIVLQGAISFTDNYQEISTQGYPTGGSMGALVVGGSE